MIDTSKVYKSNNFGNFKIIRYINNANVLVEFIDTGYTTMTQSSHITRGAVKDLLFKSVYGVGFYGINKGLEIDFNVERSAYSTWYGMMLRCYSSKYRAKFPTYELVTICNEWHDFQNFARWYSDNYIKGNELDKDIKQKGVIEKEYSPETCLFVIPTDNKV